MTRDIKLNVAESDDSETSNIRSLKSRSIIVRARVFESEMVINQKNINFGKTVVGELSTRGLSITNKSQIPLLYSIAKSGSISSLFLTVSNNREKGIIRALSTKTIEFAFKPNLAGQYEETLILENVLNTTNSQGIVIKANVLKQQLFQLLPIEVNPLMVDDEGPEPSEIENNVNTFLNSKFQETLTVSPLPIFNLGTFSGANSRSSFQFKLVNVSTKQRTFVIEFIQFDISNENVLKPYINDALVDLVSSYNVTNQPEQSKSGLSADERKYLEDKLEKLSQKLVIAKRKENAEKIVKYEKKISDLKAKLETETKEMEVLSQPLDVVPIVTSLDESGKLSFSLGPEEGAVVVVTISASLRRLSTATQPLPTCGMLKIYEAKNRDDMRYIYFGVVFLPSNEEIQSLGERKLSSDIQEFRTAEDLDVSNRPSIEKETATRPYFIEVEQVCSFNSRKYYPRYRTPFGVILKKGLELLREKSDSSTFVGEFSIISEALETVDLFLFVVDDPLLNSPSDSSNLFGSIRGNWKIRLRAQTWSNSLSISNSLREELRVSLAPGERVTCQLTWVAPADVQELLTGLVCVKLSQTSNIDSKIIPIICNAVREANIITDKHVLFGEIQLGKVYTHELILRNKLVSDDIRYTAQIVASSAPATDTLQIVEGGEGLISANGISTLLLVFNAKFLGKFDYTLRITNVFSNSSVTVAINAAVTLPQSKFVIYPDIECDEAGKSNKLDLGLIQVPVVKPNDYEFKIQFRILNTSNDLLLVSALSNLKKQVLIYSDSECTNMTSYFPLDVGVITPLTIVIRPANLPLDGAELGRELIGGIRLIYFVKDFTKDGESEEDICRKVYESSVNFKAVVGRSKLRVSPSCTQFLCSRFDVSKSTQNGLIKGYLTLENISPTFPLSYQVPGVEEMDEMYSSKEIVKKNPNIGRGKFVIFDGNRGLIPPSSKKWLKFAVVLDDVSGVMIKTLSFENLSTGEIETLELKFFFDSRAIISYYPSQNQSDVFLPNNKFLYLPGLLYSQGFFVTELSSKRISTPIWISPFTSKSYSSVLKSSAASASNELFRNNVTLLPETNVQDPIYITTGGEPVVLFEWRITNPSKHALRIAPASDLPITVSFEASTHSTEIKQIYMMPTKRSSKSESLKIGSKSKNSQSEDQRASMTSLPRDLQKRGFSICGDITTIPALSTMTVKVGYKKGQPLNASHYQHLLMGDRTTLSAVSVAGGITFISAAQSLQSFFRPSEREDVTTLSTSEIESDTCPVVHFTPVTCQFIVPALKIINTQINLGLIKSYKPYFFTIEIENLSHVDIPFRIENLSTWMLVMNSEPLAASNDAKSSNRKTNVSMTARSKCITAIEIKVNVPQDKTEKNILHTLRIRNLALSTPQSYSLRDAATVDVIFEIDPFNPLQIKDSMGSPLQFSRLTHSQFLRIQSGILVPHRPAGEPVLSTGKFLLSNSSSFGLRLLPSLQCIAPLQHILSVTLKKYEEGSGVATTDTNFEGIDLLPGEMVRLSIEISSLASSRLDDDLLKQLEIDYIRSDVVIDDDHESESPAIDELIFGHQPVGPIQITKIVFKFVPLADTQNTWPPVDAPIMDTVVPDEIALDVIGSIAFAPTHTIMQSQTIQQAIDFSATLSDGNIKSGIFWKCQPLNLPLHILNSFSQISLQNTSHTDSSLRIISSQIVAIPDTTSKGVEITRLACDNLLLRAAPSTLTTHANSKTDFEIQFISQKDIEVEEDISEYSDLFEKYLYQYMLQSQKANSIGPSTILALGVIACYDQSFPMHPPLICPVYIKLTAEPIEEISEKVEVFPRLEAPNSPLRKEILSQETNAADTSIIPTLLLRGVTPCLPYVNQFEINLGQQFQNAESTDWTLSLENLSSNSKLRYRISTLSPDDSKWISLAQSGGVINPGGTASLVLYFSLKNVGVFATYLIIENLSNPIDTCVVRTSVQVVQDWRKRNIFKGDENDSDPQQKVLFRIESSQITRDPGIFKETIVAWNQLDSTNRKRSYMRLPTSVDYSQATHVIDFGQVFVGQRYTRRSFVIANLSDISLDFQLSSNISPRELSFSLTPVSPRTCYAVTVHPRERRFIYVIFRPLTRDNQKSSEQDSFRKFWKIEGSIFVSCNLVKNHHETIKVYSSCGLRMFGAFAMKQENSFDSDPENNILQVSVPEHNDFGIENLPSEEISAVEGTSLFSGTDYSWHSANNILIRKVDPNFASPLLLRVYSCMKSFRLEIYRTTKSTNNVLQQHLELLPLTWARGGGVNGGATVDFDIFSPAEEYIIRVIVDTEDSASKSLDGRQRYGHYCIGAEDHFMIYNRASPVEKCRIPVRLLIQSGTNTVDLFEEDPVSIAATVGSTLSFSGLEGIIISFLKEFSTFWSDVLSLTNESIIASSDVTHHQEFLHQNSGVSANQINHTNNFMVSMTEHSRNNDYITYGTRSGTDILAALEYFFLRLKYCVKITESEIIPNERFKEYLRVYPDESDIYPVVHSLSLRYLDICFHFGAITDLIVLYSMRQSSFGHEIMTAAHTGLPVGRLALLFYSVVFRHPVFEIIAKIPPEYCREGIGSTLSVPIYPFAKQILYYGSFFSNSKITDGGYDQNPLLDIMKTVKASFIDMKI